MNIVKLLGMCPMDVKDIRENDQQLTITLHSSRARTIVSLAIALILTWFPFCIVSFVLLVINPRLDFNWREYPLIYFIMKFFVVLVLWLSVRFIRQAWNICVNYQTLINFDKKSGCMTVSRRKDLKSIPIKNIFAIILLKVCQNQNDVQLLLKQSDGAILSLDLNPEVAITPMGDETEQYELLARRIGQFLNVPLHYVSRDTYWQGENNLVLSSHEPGNC
ncbi:hypothetical protein [Roseiflexus sp.]|uniref:hypothetical protein n=1 Tax=Roseiflexus sp. TaxID=2562120 RepID=UPI00398AFFFF